MLGLNVKKMLVRVVNAVKGIATLSTESHVHVNV